MEVDCNYIFEKPGLSSCVILCSWQDRFYFHLAFFYYYLARTAVVHEYRYVIKNIYAEIGFSGGIVTSHLTYTPLVPRISIIIIYTGAVTNRYFRRWIIIIIRFAAATAADRDEKNTTTIVYNIRVTYYYTPRT